MKFFYNNGASNVVYRGNDFFVSFFSYKTLGCELILSDPFSWTEDVLDLPAQNALNDLQLSTIRKSPFT